MDSSHEGRNQEVSTEAVLQMNSPCNPLSSYPIILPTRTSPLKGLNISKRNETYPKQEQGNPEHNLQSVGNPRTEINNFAEIRYIIIIQIYNTERKGITVKKVYNSS